MTTATTEDAPAPEGSPLHLRDRLRTALTRADVPTPEVIVEAVCAEFSLWLRALADDWHSQSALSADLYGQAAALVTQGIADGIEAGAPQG